MSCIWYVSKYVSPPSQGSMGGRGYMLMREVAALGHQSVIVTSDSNQLGAMPTLDGPVWLQQVDGMTVCWLRTLKYQVAKSARRILSWIDFEWRLLRLSKKQLPRPDVVVVSSLSLLTILNGFVLRWRYKCRLVLEIRDIWPLSITEEGGFSPRNPLVLGLGWVEWMGYRWADDVVGTMPNLQEHVAQVLGRARPAHCIPMGVDDAALHGGQDLPAEYVQAHIPQGRFIVAHAGTIGITNALETFLDCAESLQDDPRLHFLVVGEGDLRAEYQRRYAHVRNLSFAPRVPKAMVQSVLSHCDLLYFSVHPSKVWRYGQSLNKVIDYMLAGKPVVASYTGYPSMINEAGCGSYVPAGSVADLRREIQRYAAMDPDERGRVGALGRQWLLTTAATLCWHGSTWTFSLPAGTLGRPRAMSKRVFDLCAAAALLLLLGLPLLVLAWLVRRKLGSPVLFRQVRPGLHGRAFEMVKFRTMTDERDALGQPLPDVQRLTPFGRWLRASSLDELPELWNVLKGDMSLVGPRPLLMEYLALYTPEQARRHDVRPGITGWAQVNGRNAIGWDERFKLDVWYVDHQSLVLDIRILWLTFSRVLRRDGISAAGEATMSRFTGSAPRKEGPP